MSRAIHKLTSLSLRSAAKKGETVADGGGLYLQRGRSWTFRFCRNGRTHWLGLGSLAEVDLVTARTRAAEVRRLLHEGRDPLGERATKTAKERIGRTFAEAAKAYLVDNQAGWKNSKHVAQWYATLTGHMPDGSKSQVDYCRLLHHVPIGAVDTSLVLAVLKPIWQARPETASRLRGRIEAVLGWAAVHGLRDPDTANPARWSGHLANVLPAKGSIRKVEHHAALPYPQVAGFVSQLRQVDGTSARALEFVILSAARTGEALGATWAEIDLDRAVWTVPGQRMKAGREHRVPLSGPAIALLGALPRNGSLVFPGAKANRSLSNMALTMQLRRMQRGHITAHGFRSTFRDWAAETTNFENHVVEMALAHVIASKVEAAYRRGDLFEKRQRLMAEWATYCVGLTAGTVVPLRA